MAARVADPVHRDAVARHRPAVVRTVVARLSVCTQYGLEVGSEPAAFAAAAHIVASLRADEHGGLALEARERDEVGIVGRRRRWQVVLKVPEQPPQSLGAIGFEVRRPGAGAVAPMQHHPDAVGRSAVGGCNRISGRHSGQHPRGAHRQMHHRREALEQAFGEDRLRPRQRHFHQCNRVGADSRAAGIKADASGVYRAARSSVGSRKERQHFGCQRWRTWRRDCWVRLDA